MSHRRRCQDCGRVVTVYDRDSLALCPDCVADRDRAELELAQGDGQAGARWCGKLKEEGRRKWWG